MQYFAFRWLSLLLSQVAPKLQRNNEERGLEIHQSYKGIYNEEGRLVMERKILLFWLQEFPLPDVLSLWDALLTDQTR